MKENRGSIVLSILILIVVGAAAFYIVQSVQQTTQQAVAPFQQANNSLQTQVSDLLHPTPTIIPDPVTYINQIQALARLETIQFSVQQVVEADFNQGTFGFIFGNKILCQVKAKIIAGIDMQKLQPGDLSVQNGVLYVKLPAPEIFVNAVDESQTQIFDLQTGAFANPDPNQVIVCIQAAKDKIYKAAIDDGIYDLAEQNAETYLAKFFTALGYKNTIFQATPPAD
ncbi:MAG TPA: DUF4230 domain-containing protein [Anaerolineales bacterium]|jgi:hypothetical protein|nr:DUF4230 domain-containing protein [Anaerolineales bacterium]